MVSLYFTEFPPKQIMISRSVMDRPIVNDKDAVCDIPCAVSNVILIDWLCLPSIVRLDSAYCNRKRRGQFLQLLSAPECVLRHNVVFKDDQWSPIPWIVLKAVKVSEVVFFPRVLAVEHQRCLQIVGSTVKSITYAKNLPLQLCAMYCHQLVSLTLFDVRIDEALRDVLLSNPCLRELRLLPDTQADTADLAGVRCPSLRLVSICRNTWSNRYDVMDAFALQVVSMSASILQLDLHGSHITDSGLLQIAAQCPRLYSLGLAHVPVSSDAVLEVCGVCPDIVNLDLRSRGMNFTGIADFLPAMRAVAVHGIGSWGVFVRTHAATLHTLDVSLCSMADVAQIVAHCPLLRSVGITTVRGERRCHLDSAMAVFANITTLSLRSALEGVWESVADNCPNLTHLGVFGSENKYGLLSTAGMDRVLEMCSKLRIIETDARSVEYLQKRAYNRDLCISSCRNLSEFKLLLVPSTS